MQASRSSRETVPSPACRGGLGWGASVASKFNHALKPKQPHPKPPLRSQGRACITVSQELHRLVTLLDEQQTIYSSSEH